MPASSSSAPSTPATPASWNFSPLSPNLSAPLADTPPSLPALVGSEGFGEFRLPATFWAGSHSLLGCHLVDVPRESFGNLRRWDAGCADGWDGMPRLPLQGGRARANLTGQHAPTMRTLKVGAVCPTASPLTRPALMSAPSPPFQIEKNRLLVSWHRDGTARFFDIVRLRRCPPFPTRRLLTRLAPPYVPQSPQLLVLPDPLSSEYPSPLPALSILLQPLLAHPFLSALPIARLLRSDATRFQIDDVQLAADAAEVAVVLATGEVVYFRWSEAREDLEVQAQMAGLSLGAAKAGDIVDLRPLSDWSAPAFDLLAFLLATRADLACSLVLQQRTASSPSAWSTSAGVPSPRAPSRMPVRPPVAPLVCGPLLTCSPPLAGFLAISYLQNSVCIVDLRGPEIILREGFGDDGGGGERRGSVSAVAKSLKFAVSGLGSGASDLRSCPSPTDAERRLPSLSAARSDPPSTPGREL